jgi:hypothetical protein
MSRETTLIILALLTILSPFVGLPYSWLMVVVPLLGVGVLALGIILRIRRLHGAHDTMENPVHVSVPTDETHQAT